MSLLLYSVYKLMGDTVSTCLHGVSYSFQGNIAHYIFSFQTCLYRKLPLLFLTFLLHAYLVKKTGNGYAALGGLLLWLFVTVTDKS